RPQVAERALRVWLRLPTRASLPGRGVRGRRAIPRYRRPARLGIPRAGVVTPRACLRNLGDATRIRAERLPDDGRAPPRAGAACRRAGRGRARARTARAGEAERRLLPPQPARPRRRGGARRAEPPRRRGRDRGWPRLLRPPGLPPPRLLPPGLPPLP